MNIWILALTVIITVVPLVKMAKEKRFGIYNFFVVLVGSSVLILSILKNVKDERTEIDNQKASSENLAKIDKLVIETQQSRSDLSNIKKSLDSIGLTINLPNGEVIIKDKEKLKNTILSSNESTNVTSINQKGGQTARDITNN